MSIAVAKALSTALLAGVDRSSDKMVRLEVSASWPVAEALELLAREVPALQVGVLSRFRLPKFRPPANMTLDSDPATITHWRNTRSSDPENSPALVVLGAAIGESESGLRDLHVVLRSKDVATQWLSLAREEMDKFGRRPAQIRSEIAEFIADRLASGRALPAAVDLYAETLLDRNLVDHSRLQSNLYQIGLMPDEGLIGASSTSARLRLNSETVEDVLGAGETDTRLKLLERSGRKSVKAFVGWTKTRDEAQLAASEFEDVLTVLNGRKAGRPADQPPTTVDPEDPSPGPQRKVSLMTYLGDGSIDAAVRRKSLEEVREKLAHDGHKRGLLDVSTSSGPAEVTLRLKGLRDPLDGWFTEPQPIPDAEIYGFKGEQVVLGLHISDLRSDRTEILQYRASTLSNLLPESEPRLISEFLATRLEVLSAARLLCLDEQSVLELLVASPTLRLACRTYVDSWSRVLTNAYLGSHQNAKLLSLLDGIWYRDVERAESIDSPELNLDSTYTSVRLAAWHPWRLSPLLELAEEVDTNFETSPARVRSALWAVDRAIPAYRLINIPPTALAYKTTVHGGEMLFGEGSMMAIPPASGSGLLFQRTLGAYARISPWVLAGGSLSLVNPPRGGMAKAVVQSAVKRFGHVPALTLVREGGVEGVDPADDYENLTGTVDVGDLSDGMGPDEVSQDLSMVFARGAIHSHALHGGMAGPISVRLARRGFDSAGTQRYVPEIVLGAAPDNDLVLNLYRVAGHSEATSAAYELALSPHDIRKISAVAQRSGWTLVAVPGAVSAFDLRDEEGQAIARIAEFDEGAYRCFVFARSVQPLESLLSDRLRDLPVAQGVRDKLSTLIHELAVSQPQKLFDIALNRYGADEALGVLVARAVADTWIRPGSLALELSLDDASWSRDWLESERQRADFVIVEVGGDLNMPDPVRLLVVEAKATTLPFAEPALDVPPLGEAAAQVEATREQLLQLFEGGTSIISRLRMRAFAEHVASVAAYAYERSIEKDRFDNYFEVLSAFTRAPQQAAPPVEGLSVALFLSGQQAGIRRSSGHLELVSCSARALESVLQEQSLEFRQPASSTRADASGLGNVFMEGASAAPEDQSESFTPDDEESLEDDTAAVSLGAEDSELVSRLVSAMRLRSEDVGALSEVALRVGPTFISVALPFSPGASISPLERVQKDIARDTGSRQIELSNDEQRGKIRVLLPRADRQFPGLPLDGVRWAEGVDYLNFALGQDLTGADVRVPLSRWPHALVAGTTGSGKTNFLRGLLGQVSAAGPKWAQCVVVDGKGETDYFGVLDSSSFVGQFPEPLLTIDRAIDVLDWVQADEVPRRKQLVVEVARSRRARVDARADFAASMMAGADPLMTPLVVIIDEFNEIMLRGGVQKQQFIDSVTSIAQAARSVMIHLVLATQRPERSVVPGPIKANLPARVAFRLPTAADSVTILGHGGAERLLGHGDMLFQLNGQVDKRLQAYLFEG